LRLQLDFDRKMNEELIAGECADLLTPPCRRAADLMASRRARFA
jgi:hypothetical protein